jgi:RNA polymerase sigma-70 factor (ECF subfamily)
MLARNDEAQRGLRVDDRPASFRAMLDDEIAFDAWYRDALPRVYAYLYSRCGADAGLAEDLTQQAFVEAVRHPDGWNGRADLVTWIVAIGRNKLVDHFRRVGRDEQRRSELVERAELSAGASFTGTDIDIERALDLLPADQRLALVLRAADGLPVREVANILGRSEDATESLIRRARVAFRRAYDGAEDA